MRDARGRGASEAEKPEAVRPMVQAEAGLRLAIVPPIVAITIFMTISSSWSWLLGLLFSLALYVQAAAREVEAETLAARYRRAADLASLDTILQTARRALLSGDVPAAAQAINSIEPTSLISAEF